MGKKLRNGIFILLAIIAALLLFVILCTPSEPSYGGKKLTVWTVDYYHRVSPTSTESSRGGPADDAVRHMGTNAIPTLMRMLRAKDTPLKLKLIKLASKQSLIPVHYTLPFDRHKQAAVAFSVLGPVAEPVIPELARLLDDPFCCHGAAEALGGISPKALPVLLDALHHTNKNVRISAASALGHGFDTRDEILRTPDTAPLGPDARAAIAALIVASRDTNVTLRAVAASALGRIAQQPDVVIPVLIEKLHDPDAQCRRMAAQSLGWFGKEAQSAIPVLSEAAINEPDGQCKQLAGQALRSIQEEIGKMTKK